MFPVCHLCAKHHVLLVGVFPRVGLIAWLSIDPLCPGNAHWAKVGHNTPLKKMSAATRC